MGELMKGSSSAPWRVLILLVVSVAINYIDRGSLSLAAPLLKDELGISASQLGLLLSSFFWTYATFQIVSGWLVDRYDVNWILAGGFFLWSMATAVTGLVNGFGMLVAMRLLLGVGESVAYPCYSKILASRFAEHQRGLSNALIDAGTKFGPALGTLAGGVLMARFGWRPVFVVLGLGSLLWLAPWVKWMPRGEDVAESGSRAAPGLLEILRLRPAWATFAGHFCGNYFFYFLLTWLPFYLVRERHLSMDSMAGVGAAAYLVTAAATTAAGWLADRAIVAGRTPTRVRKTCTVAGLGCATVILAVTVVSDTTLSMVLLMLACASYGVYASSHWAITQTVAGPQAAGRWTGLQNFISNLAGVVAPALTGLVVEKTGHFFWAFAASAAVALAGAGIYLFLLGPVEGVKWRHAESVWR
ncbi:MAG: MFS transporter [Acidobacteria bacterium]|nr:MFS transporter [Acidobacteriota bacterium]